MNVNVWNVVDDLRALITARRPVDPDRLVDTSVSLEALLHDRAALHGHAHAE